MNAQPAKIVNKTAPAAAAPAAAAAAPGVAVAVTATVPAPAITTFELEQFEYLVTTDRHEDAIQQLIFLLGEIDGNYGDWGPNFKASTPNIKKADLNRHLCTRIAGAVTTLCSKPTFNLGQAGYRRIMGMQRWLGLIFAVSAYRNGDHIIRNRNEAGGGKAQPLTLSSRSIRVYGLCYFADSELPLQMEDLWKFDREAMSGLYFALLSSRAMPTPTAHAKRETLLKWLPERLKEITDLNTLPVKILHDVIMHSSYADLPSKHDIKKGINKLMRDAMAAGPVGRFLPVALPPTDRPKPVVCVVLEWFGKRHSIYRTHSSTLRALRSRFHVVGVGAARTADDVTRHVFDEFRSIESQDLGVMVEAITALKPDIIYYPSVGMFLTTSYLVNLRLAPLQLMALGHPATTHSPYIDGVMVEEDYVGDPACFSEPVIALPKDSLPYLPPTDVARITPRPIADWTPGQPVKIAVCASIMKINPTFLNTLAEITRRSQRPVRFCFYLGMSNGIMTDYMRHSIQQVLPDAEVNGQQPIQIYQAQLNECDLFVNPFPFGNTNGLVDTVRQGLPGVCLTGPEVHTHIDEGLFRRLGLPECLIARTQELYIREAVRLIEDDAWRNGLRRDLMERDVEAVLFKGDPMKFVAAVEKLAGLGAK